MKFFRVAVISALSLSLLTYPSVQLKAFSGRTGAVVAALAGATTATALGSCWYKNWSTLEAIGKMLSRSGCSSTNKETDFRFARWQQDRWPSAQQLHAERSKVIRQLKEDARAGSIYLYRLAGGRLAPAEVRDHDLRTAIDAELQALENYLKVVGNLCDVPEWIAKQCSDFEGSETGSYYSSHRKAIEWARSNSSDIDLGYWKTRYFSDFSSSYIKPFIMLKLPTLNPFYYRTWRLSIMPCYDRARKMYWELYARYIRLFALKKIVDGTDVTRAEKRGGKIITQMNNLKQGLLRMRALQPSTRRSIADKTKQGANVLEFIRRAVELERKFDPDREAHYLTRLREIANFIQPIPTLLDRPLVEGTDPVLGQLDSAHSSLELLQAEYEQFLARS